MMSIILAVEDDVHMICGEKSYLERKNLQCNKCYKKRCCV